MAGAPKGLSELLVEGCIASERSLEGNDAWFGGGGGGGGEVGECDAAASSPSSRERGLALSFPAPPCPIQCAWPSSIRSRGIKRYDMLLWTRRKRERKGERKRGQLGEKRGEENESDDALSKKGVDTWKKKVAEGGGGGRFTQGHSPSPKHETK